MSDVFKKSKKLVKDINAIALKHKRFPVDLAAKSKETVAQFLADYDMSREEIIDRLNTETETSGDMDFMLAAETIREFS